MNFGTKLHSFLEHLDFYNPKFDKEFGFYKKNIMYFLDSINLDKVINIYREYEFFLDDESMHGVIDLMLEYDDEIKIIDYNFFLKQDIDISN